MCVDGELRENHEQKLELYGYKEERKLQSNRLTSSSGY